MLVLVCCALAHADPPAPATARPDLSGVVMAGEKPVSRAIVYVYTAGPRVGTSPYCPSCYADCGKRATTDKSGAFKIPSLDPQLIFRILVVAEGYEPMFVPGVDPAMGPMRAELKKRKVAIDVHHTIRGRVVDQEFKPIVGAEVSPFGMKTGARRWWGSTQKEVDPLAITNDRGEFTLITREADVEVDLDIRGRGAAPAKFALVASGPKIHDFQLVRGATITGRLVHDGKPVPNVAVGIVQADRRVEAFVGESIIGTDAEGRFTFVNIKPNAQYFVYGKMDSLAAEGLAVAAVEVDAPQTDEKKDLGDLKASAGHRLRGVVKLSDGAPLPFNTRLLVSRQQAWDSQIVSIAEDGSFQVEGLPDEEYSISVRVRGYHMSEQNYCIDPLNDCLQGRVPRDIEGLVVLFEPGNPEIPRFDKPTGTRDELLDRLKAARNGPLRGAEAGAVQPAASGGSTKEP